jgi:two-component system chemotaxis response regulator CheY
MNFLQSKNNQRKETSILSLSSTLTPAFSRSSLYVQYYLARYFNEAGLNVIDYVDNGESAVIAYKKRQPHYISLDNNMNVMTGPEAAGEIVDFDKKCRIIFITALGDSALFRKNLKENFPSENYRILTKPIYKKDVVAVLDEFS